MAEKIETGLVGIANAVLAGLLIYGLATSEMSGPGYAALAALLTFFAVGLAVRLALLGVGDDA